MYNQNKITTHSVGNTKLHLLTGSIFETETLDLDCLVIFVPLGLTSIKIEIHELLSEYYDLRDQKIGYQIFENKSKTSRSKPRYVFVNLPEVRKANYTLSQFSELLNRILKNMDSLDVRRVAMNGVRLNISAYSTQRPEKIMVQKLTRWLTKEQNFFKEFYLIDYRGGFNKHVDCYDIDIY